MKTNKGFTLIELLVVVLIIGILAAIAVPQYQKAVAKAELAQIITITRNVKEAEEVYYLANNKYTSTANLDISINNPDIECSYNSADYIICVGKNFSIVYYLRNSDHAGFSHCYANSTDENSARVYACKEFIKGQSKKEGNQDIWHSGEFTVVNGEINF